MEDKLNQETIKVAVNNFLWMHLSANSKIGDAETLACQITNLIMEFDEKLNP